MALFSFLTFSLLAILKFTENGQIIPTQNYKYPPTIYYLSYALCAINLIYLTIKKLPTTSKKMGRAIEWLSSNSLWIYLWHIMAFYIWKYLFKTNEVNLLLFLYKAIFLLTFGIAITFIQKAISDRLRSSKHLLEKVLLSFSKKPNPQLRH